MSQAHTPGRSLGGRFAEATDPILERINRSVDVDQRMWSQDLAGSMAHVQMLGSVGLLSEDDVSAISRGLTAIRSEFEAGTFAFEEADEDIHMAVERRLTELVGQPARRLHTGRSRNDQVMTDLMLWMREEGEAMREVLVGLIEAFLTQAQAGHDTPMPSFTHLQPAQVSSVAQWALSHAAELVGHLRRWDDFLARLDQCPLGSGASVGSYLPLDRQHTAKALGFARPSLNAMASTGGRTEVMDALGVLAMIGSSISRLGEELVIFASPLFGFIRLPDRLTTGSSLLPQKRNPDGAELLRGEGKMAAQDFAGLVSATSGLLSGYAKDLQCDKTLLFRAWDRTTDLLTLAGLHVEALAFDEAKLRAACKPSLASLWLADQLVLSGLPFRRAHHWVGLAARAGSERGLELAEAFAAVIAEHDDAPEAGERLAKELTGLTPDDLLAGLATEGSAGPESTRAQVVAVREMIGGA